MTIKNKETLEKLRTYQIGVIRSVITSRQGRLGTYLADATDRERWQIRTASPMRSITSRPLQSDTKVFVTM